MSGRVLLDTNVVVALFNEEPKVARQIELTPEVFLPSVVLGELHYGAAHSTRPEANAARFESFAEACIVVGIDSSTARHYGQLKADLRRKGRPIPENDLWIAACALQHNLILVTRDRHFDELSGLTIEAW